MRFITTAPGPTIPPRTTTALFAGSIQNVGRRYVGGYAGYEITPLLKWTNYFVLNIADRSRFYSPQLTFSLRTSVDFTVAVLRRKPGNGICPIP